MLHFLGCYVLTAQSKFCWDLYFSQRPTFESDQTTDLASLKGIVFPGIAISYTWPFKKTTRFDLAQRFVAGSLVNWVKFHAEKEFISDGWENSSRMPLLSPFISWGVIGKKSVFKSRKLEVEAFASPQANFFIPFDYPVSYSMIKLPYNKKE